MKANAGTALHYCLLLWLVNCLPPSCASVVFKNAKTSSNGVTPMRLLQELDDVLLKNASLADHIETPDAHAPNSGAADAPQGSALPGSLTSEFSGHNFDNSENGENIVDAEEYSENEDNPLISVTSGEGAAADIELNSTLGNYSLLPLSVTADNDRHGYAAETKEFNMEEANDEDVSLTGSEGDESEGVVTTNTTHNPSEQIMGINATVNANGGSIGDGDATLGHAGGRSVAAANGDDNSNTAAVPENGAEENSRLFTPEGTYAEEGSVNYTGDPTNVNVGKKFGADEELIYSGEEIADEENGTSTVEGDLYADDSTSKSFLSAALNSQIDDPRLGECSYAELHLIGEYFNNQTSNSVCRAYGCVDENYQKYYNALLNNKQLNETYNEQDKHAIAEIFSSCWCRCPMMECELQFIKQMNSSKCLNATINLCSQQNSGFIKSCVHAANVFPQLYNITLDPAGFQSPCAICNSKKSGVANSTEISEEALDNEDYAEEDDFETISSNNLPVEGGLNSYNEEDNSVEESATPGTFNEIGSIISDEGNNSTSLVEPPSVPADITSRHDDDSDEGHNTQHMTNYSTTVSNNSSVTASQGGVNASVHYPASAGIEFPSVDEIEIDYNSENDGSPPLLQEEVTWDNVGNILSAADVEAKDEGPRSNALKLSAQTFFALLPYLLVLSHVCFF